MSQTSTVKITRVHNGMIEAVVTGDGAQPAVGLYLAGDKLSDVTASPRDGGGYDLQAAVPVDVVSDGVHLLQFRDKSGAALAHVTIIAGQPLEQDLHTEVALLRAELDLLKTAFRDYVRRAKR